LLRGLVVWSWMSLLVKYNARLPSGALSEVEMRSRSWREFGGLGQG
jgi:hypothetical protein